jgi:hypothetical protein
MYRLPSDVDLGFFCGKTLIQLCMGFSDLILRFHPDISITVTSSIGYRHDSERLDRFESLSMAACAIRELLNQEVSSANGDSKGTLTLGFSGGNQVEIYDDSEHYESYVIKHGEKLIVV